MTRAEHEIRRSILRKLRMRLAAEEDRARKAYLLGLEAGELMKGSTGDDLRTNAHDRAQLQRNFEEARDLGVQIDITINEE